MGFQPVVRKSYFSSYAAGPSRFHVGRKPCFRMVRMRGTQPVAKLSKSDVLWLGTARSAKRLLGPGLGGKI